MKNDPFSRCVHPGYGLECQMTRIVIRIPLSKLKDACRDFLMQGHHKQLMYNFFFETFLFPYFSPINIVFYIRRQTFRFPSFFKLSFQPFSCSQVLLVSCVFQLFSYQPVRLFEQYFQVNIPINHANVAKKPSLFTKHLIFQEPFLQVAYL